MAANDRFALNDDVGGSDSDDVDHGKGDVPTPNTDEPKPSQEKKKSGKKERPPMVPFHRLYRFATPFDALLMIVGTLGAAASGASRPVYMIFFGELFDAFNGSNLLDEVIQLCLIFIYIGIITLAATYLETVCFITTAERQSARCREEYVGAILRQEVAFYDKHNAGALASRVTSDTITYADGLGEYVGKLANALGTLIAGFTVAFVKGWQMTLVMLAITPLMGVTTAGIMGYAAKLQARKQDAYAKAGGVAAESLAGIRTVDAFSGEQREATRFSVNLLDARSIGYKKGFMGGLGMGLMFLIMFGSYGLALWYGAQLIVNNSYTGGDVVTVFFCVMVGGFALGGAAPGIEAIGNARGAALKIYEIIDRKSQIDASSDEGEKLDPAAVQGKVELSHVHFAYPTRPDVQIFRDMNLVVEPGQRVALVGPSGCGKSSTVSLVERLYDPIEGAVLLDGRDVRKLNIKSLRQQIGLVGQEPVLFSGTIAENIAFGKPGGATPQEIKKAAKLANAHTFIKAFPNKYATLVGERGAQLSGGQKQRIAIARALVRNPKILLLDEATSALDSVSEKVVQDALETAMNGRTTIIIAHRLSTIRNADWIAVLDQGHVAERGTHDELMALNGIYAGLVRMQEDQSKAESGDVEVVSVPEADTVPEEAVAKMSVEEDDDVEFGLGRGKVIPKAKSKAKKGDNEQSGPSAPDVPMSRIFKLNMPEWPYYAVGLVGAALLGGVFPAFSLVFSEMITEFYRPKDEIPDAVVRWSALFAGVGGAAFVAHLLTQTMFTVAAERLTYRLRNMSFSAMLRQEIGWFDRDENATGVLTARLATDAALIEGLLGTRLGLLLQNFLTIIAVLAIAFSYGWKLALVTLACGPVLVFGNLMRFLAMKGFTEKAQEKLADANRVSSEAIGNIRTVAAFGLEHRAVEAFSTELEGPMKLAMRSGNISGLLLGFGQFGTYGVQALVFWYGATLVDSGEMTFGDMLKVIMSIIMGAMSVGQSSAMMSNASKAKAAAKEVFKVIDRKPEIEVARAGKTVPAWQGDVRLENVKFAYPTRPGAVIFDGLNLSIAPGKSLAIVGPSGSGKSTVVSLLERFYDPAAGCVLVGDAAVDLQQLDLAWWRRQIALVGQEPVLFAGTIAENIAYGKPDATMDEIQQAAQAANAHKFITKFPKGYDTFVGEKGAQVSGGQKQRIAIARAIIRNPKLLLLDEATSALDTESEKIVQKALDRVMQDRTTIVIAHRLSTIRNVDQIAVLSGGTVVEIGNYADLMARRGHFFQLVQQQFGGTPSQFNLLANQ